MKLITQSHEILNPDPAYDLSWKYMVNRLETAGRTCYQSDPTDESSDSWVNRRIVRSGHHSVLEHEVVQVRFITDRGVTHELVRHRIAAFSQESTRYCNYGGDDIQFVIPVGFRIPEGVYDARRLSDTSLHFKEVLWATAMLQAEQNYKGMLVHGAPPQEARAVLPNSLKTTIVMTVNLREMLHILDLRTSKAAHPQIRALMLPLLCEMRDVLPCVFGRLADDRTDS